MQRKGGKVRSFVFDPYYVFVMSSKLILSNISQNQHSLMPSQGSGARKVSRKESIKQRTHYAS